MKRLAMLLPAIVLIGISLVNTPAIGKAVELPYATTELPVRTVTKKDPARVNSHPHVPKPKIFRSNPLRKSLIITGSDPEDTVDDEDCIVNAYRRPIEPKKPKVDDDDVSDYVRWRLFLARQLAMMKYREIHG